MAIIVTFAKTSQNETKKILQITAPLDNNKKVKKEIVKAAGFFLYFCTVKIYPKLSAPY